METAIYYIIYWYRDFLTSCPSLHLTAFQTKPKAPLPTALTGWYSSLNWPSQARVCSRSMVERSCSPWLASIIYRREEKMPQNHLCILKMHYRFTRYHKSLTDLSLTGSWLVVQWIMRLEQCSLLATSTHPDTEHGASIREDSPTYVPLQIWKEQILLFILGTKCAD